MNLKTDLNKNFILNAIKSLGMRYGTHEAFSDVVTCCAFALANKVDFQEVREKEFARIIDKYNDEEKALFPKILASLVYEYSKNYEPIDILGNIYEELNLIKKGHAQFFTPLEVCKVMAKIAINKDENQKSLDKRGYISVSDPACGSGRNIYAAYNELLENNVEPNKILLIADDVDLTCCCITYIQLSLMGANAIVHHQNTLTMDLYETFYTMSYANNEELQENLKKEKEKEGGYEDEL